jgi:hypothetical protein
MGANSAALAIKEVCHEIAFFILINTAFGTEYLAHAAFYTFTEIVRRSL